MPTQTKIALLTGYLGAGKTTLLNHILANEQGVRVAVLVNDIGQINVDASLIAKSGFAQMDGELIPMTNGCICCTLAGDLGRQLNALAKTGDFDYILIEASGICEPIPIAYTISNFCKQSQFGGTAPLDLDNIIAVVDCARMWDEFAGGHDLLEKDIEEDDIRNLLIQQIEFCSTLVLNKTDAVTPAQVAELRGIVRGLQRQAKIIEAVQGDVPLGELLDTGRFSFERAFESAAWIDALDHPEEHEDPEALEYGIRTFVYQRRRPFDLDALKACVASWPREVIRAKGQLWVAQDPDVCHVFEQAGRQTTYSDQGFFVAAAPEFIKKQLIERDPSVLDDWDPVCGDRMTKICIIGRNINEAELTAGLDACLR